MSATVSSNNINDLTQPETRPRYSLGRKCAAWAVHAYTASGLVLAGLMAWLTLRGTDAGWRGALGLMVLATFIDSTDGWLARRVGIKQVVPGFDGRRLDDIVDFHTYTSLPLFLLWQARVLPPHWTWALFVPLLASVYGFSQTDAKTSDGYFLGFPSYWNVIALYLYLLPLTLGFKLLVLFGFAALTFVPSRYLYPSQKTPYSFTTNLLAALWGALVLFLLVTGPAAPHWLAFASLFFPIYYLAVSAYVTWRTWQRNRPPMDTNKRR